MMLVSGMVWAGGSTGGITDRAASLWKGQGGQGQEEDQEEKEDDQEDQEGQGDKEEENWRDGRLWITSIPV